MSSARPVLFPDLKGETVEFGFNPRDLPNGTVLLFRIRYQNNDEPGGDTRGRTNPKVYEYAVLKAAGVWFVTGSGKVPIAAGWAAVERWLDRDGRVVESIVQMTQLRPLYRRPVERPETRQEHL